MNLNRSFQVSSGIFAVAFCLTLVGCSSGGREMHAVTGTLTHNGDPIPEMMICFDPVDADKNPASSAVTDANGNFELEVGNTKGVAPGEYIVYVQDPIAVMGGQTSTEASYQAVLKKYGDVTTSPIRITVEEAKYNYDLELD